MNFLEDRTESLLIKIFKDKFGISKSINIILIKTSKPFWLD